MPMKYTYLFCEKCHHYTPIENVGDTISTYGGLLGGIIGAFASESLKKITKPKKCFNCDSPTLKEVTLDYLPSPIAEKKNVPLRFMKCLNDGTEFRYRMNTGLLPKCPKCGEKKKLKKFFKKLNE